MSRIKVEVLAIQDIRPHTNADALELATVGGWQVCVQKGSYQNGDKVVYFEQGTVLPIEVAERLGVARYLVSKTDLDGNKVQVVYRVKLRGEPSFGLVIPAETNMTLGQDVTADYQAKKYYPPVNNLAGQAAADHPYFLPYTDIENLRSYPEVLVADEEVVVTEKIHGTNCRVGFVLIDGEIELMAGSKTLRRQRPESDDMMAYNTYWYPHSLPCVQALLDALAQQGHHQAILYGEVFGKGIQSYHYGQPTLAFRAFDLMVDGQYLGYDAFSHYCQQYQIATVPLCYRGPFALKTIQQWSDGDSLIGGQHGREGVVVRPVCERNHVRIGRVILKYIGDHYLFGKAAAQDTTDQ